MSELDKKFGTRMVKMSRIRMFVLEKWWIIILVACIAIVCTGGYKVVQNRSALQNSKYYSYMKVYIDKEKPEEGTDLGVNYAALITSDDVIKNISSVTNGMTAEEVKNSIMFDQQSGSKVLTIGVLTDDRENCSIVMDGITQYGLRKIEEITGDKSLTILSYPLSPSKKYVVPNTTTTPTGVTFQNQLGKYTIMDWTELEQMTSMKSVIKKSIESGVLAAILAVICLIAYSMCDRKIRYQEDLAQFGETYNGIANTEEAYNGVVKSIEAVEMNKIVLFVGLNCDSFASKYCDQTAKKLEAYGYNIALLGKEQRGVPESMLRFTTNHKDFAQSMRQLRESVDYILINESEMRNYPVEKISDCSVILTGKGRTNRSEFIEKIEELESKGNRLLAFVLLKANK